MRLLLINELYQYGGAEMQTFREADIFQKHGHQVQVITLDPNYDDGKLDDFHINISQIEGKFTKQMHRLFCDRRLKKRLKQLIWDFDPDYIHINNAYDHAIPIFQSVKGFVAFQTIRDYGTVCPNGLCVHPDKTICNGYQCLRKCTICCFVHSKHKIKDFCKWLFFKRRNAVRKMSVKRFVCPSQMLTDYCIRQRLQTECINNPFDFSIIENIETNKIKTTTKKYLYYGLIVEHKGIQQMIQAFSVFSKDKEDVELDLLGRVPKEYKPTLEALINEYGRGKIHYLGFRPYLDTIKMLSTVYAVVIPSLWIENYPNTALEAASMGCLVLSSERGGMKEIVGSECFVFHILQMDEIVAQFENTYKLTEEEYAEIIRKSMERVRKNNTVDLYYDRLIKFLDSLKQ